MKYEIDIRPQAAADLDGIQEKLIGFSQDVADRTCQAIKSSIYGLLVFPRRYALAPESARATIEVRHVIVGNYRVIYSIIGPTIRIMRIVHAAQQTIDPIGLY